MTIIRNIGHILALLLLTSSLGSCVYDNEDEPGAIDTSSSSMLSLDIKVPSMRVEAADGNNNQYEEGIDYENYVDLTSKGLRIYIFDSENRYITRLIPLGDVTTDNTGNKERYTVTGVLPANFPTTSNFKVAVLANWLTYTDDLTAGVSTIDDLSSAEWAKFERLTDFKLSADNKIPMFGIHEYTNITVTPGETTVLNEEISLLRAMAKVEIVLDNEALSLSSVAIRGLNSKGYCAPAGVYSHTDYDHNGQWDKDYVKTLNIPGYFNDKEQENKVAQMYRKSKNNGSAKETWVCYVPEYRNTNNSDGTTNYKSHIELLFDHQDDTEKPYSINFQEYDNNGKPIADSDFDIHRNNLYRFTVKLSLSGLIIKVNKWENAYDNDFIFE